MKVVPKYSTHKVVTKLNGNTERKVSSPQISRGKYRKVLTFVIFRETLPNRGKSSRNPPIFKTY